MGVNQEGKVSRNLPFFGIWLVAVDGNRKGMICSGYSYLPLAVSDMFLLSQSIQLE